MVAANLVRFNHDDAVATTQLFAILYDEANVYHHHWRQDDLVIWDNIALQHGRPADHELRRLRDGAVEDAQQFLVGRILVSRRPTTRPGSAGVVWDSGRVRSGQQAFVPYTGPRLQGDAQYWWTVSTGDGAAASRRTSANAICTPAVAVPMAPCEAEVISTL